MNWRRDCIEDYLSEETAFSRTVERGRFKRGTTESSKTVKG
jgi:hypothetical protein